MIFSHLSSTGSSMNSGVSARGFSAKWLSFGARQRSSLLVAFAPFLLGGAIAAPAVLFFQPPAQAQSQAPINFNQVLRRNDVSRDVLELQRKLVEKGFLSGMDITRRADARFGAATEAAVEAFQRSQGDLVVDGIAGPNTLQRLFGVDSSALAVKKAFVQAHLRELGYYQGNLDGEFGNSTRRAIEELSDEFRLGLRFGTDENRVDELSERVALHYAEQRQFRDLASSNSLTQQVRGSFPAAQTANVVFPGGIGGERVNANPPINISQQASIPGAPYMVIIPVNRQPERFREIQRVVPSAAFITSDPRGEYARIGAFRTREDANEWVNYLQGEGFQEARILFD